MSGKKVGMILAVVCAILLAGNVVVYLISDNSAPVITFSKSVPVYAEGMTDEELLANVKAEDRQDGDLTDQVMIEKISKRSSGVQVTYLVKDSSNHVSTAVQTLAGTGGETETAATKTPEATPTQAEATATPVAEATKPEETVAEQAPAEPTEEVNPEVPVITLNTNAVTLKKGETFSYAKYIDSFSDDKDNKDTLGRNIQVSGADTSKKGTQEVRYYITDSDGNRSTEAVLTLTIE